MLWRVGIVAGMCAVAALVWFVFENHRKRKTCEHGVPRAAGNPGICEECYASLQRSFEAGSRWTPGAPAKPHAIRARSPAIPASAWIFLFQLAIFAALLWAAATPDVLSKSWKGACGFLLFLLGPMVLVAFFKLREDIARITEGRRRAAAPCAHGIPGAAASHELCEKCTSRVEAERNEREEAQRQRAAEAAFQAEARRLETQRKKAEFAERVRTLSFLAEMSPMDFQRLTWLMYERLGYAVTETPAGRDGGVDGFLEKDGKKFVLQCKRFKSDVGEPILRDLYGTAHHHGAHGAILVTTGRVSTHAREFCEGKPIELIDGKELLGRLESAMLTAEVIPDSWVGMGTPNALKDEKPHWQRACPKCSAETRQVKLPSGKTFVECSNFPRCSYRWERWRWGHRRRRY